MNRIETTYTVRVWIGSRLVATIGGFSTRSAAAARATRESYGVRLATVGGN